MLFKRVVVVLALAPIVLALLFVAPPAVFKLFILGCVFLCLWEFFRITSYSKRQMIFGIGLGGLHAAFILFFPWTGELLLLEHSFILMALAILFVFLAQKHFEGSFSQLGFSFFGIFYAGSLTAFVGLLRDFPQGDYLILLLLGMTWLNDTAAYFFGHYWGKRRLASHISPGKTVEGFLGGFLGTALGFFLFGALFKNPISIGQGIPLIVAIGIVGPMGDLSESLLKRNFGVKDSGTMIPGHGGILDRVDALLFTAPVFYAVLKYWVFR